MTRLRVINEVTDEIICDLPGDQFELAKKLADNMAAKEHQRHVVLQFSNVYRTKEQQDGAEQAHS